MAIVVTRTESQLSATGAFQALDNIGTASVSSSFTVPQGVSAIRNLAIAVTADASEEYVPLVKISGNAMRDGDAIFAGGANVASTTATGTAQNFVDYDTNLAVQSGNSVEMAIAVTDNATISCAITATFE
mgnify:CR=1 FL=1|tara:strand:- start:228 stop:617 length:390 start_codon:yes stop_codon:yes gene_type:complete